MTLSRITIPPAFAQDHVARDLPSGDYVKVTRRGWTFDCTRDDLEEWLSDATYYSDIAQEHQMGREYFGLQCSARATVRRVNHILRRLDATT
jgi:hypothetical protein